MRSESWLARPRNLTPGGIHDDVHARSLGFAGGFVPGVVLYEHIVTRLLDHGDDWLHGGHAVFERFRRPVYDGEEVRFTIDAERGTFSVTSPDGTDERARGLLSFGDAPPELQFDALGALPGDSLGDPAQIGAEIELRVATDAERVQQVERAEPHFVRRSEEGTVYPLGLWLNPIDLIRAHISAPVTVHVGGEVWHEGAPLLGETIVKRGRITGFSEYNRNRVVHFDVVVTTGGGRSLATLRHASVYRLARADAAEQSPS